jgi:hypothetical protein
MKEFLIQNPWEARRLGEELERKFPNLRQRLLEPRDKGRILEGSRAVTPMTRIAACAGDSVPRIV